jgi:PAS domain S-box-containing protein
MNRVVTHCAWLAILLSIVLRLCGPESCPAAAATLPLGTTTGRNAPINAADVLIMDSYHPGYPWSDDELAGILEVFAQADGASQPSIEYLDCKQFPEAERADWLRAYLRAKYAARRFRLLILMDNPALNVGLAVRDEMFPGAAVVFCGVNGYRPELLAGQPGVTGVAEVLDAANTVELALKLHPNAREVVVVSDRTGTGLATRRELEEALPQFAGRAQFHFLDDLPIEAAASQLESVPSDRLVLLLSYAVDRSGQVFSHAASTRRLCASCPVPVYAVHELRLGHGIIGGSLLDARLHGARAAEMALRILKGDDASRIPIEMKSTSRLMFDDRQLRRFHVPHSALPAGAIVINEPRSTFAEHRTLILCAVSALLGLSLITLVLTLSNLRRRRVERALRESEERYRALFQGSTDALLVLDAGGRIRDANEAALQRYGYSRPEMLALPIRNLSVREAQALVPFRFSQALHTGDRFESTHRRKDGAEFPVEISAHPIVLGGTRYVFTNVRDVTDRKRAEEERDRLFNMSLDMLCVAGFDGYFKQTNPAWERSLGWSAEQLCSRPWLDLVHPDDRPATIEAGARLVSGHVVSSFENRYQHRDGTYRWISWSCYPLPNERQIVAVARDVTEHKGSEEALRRIEWLLDPSQKGAPPQKHAEGRLAALIRSRLILDSVSEGLLRTIVSDFLDLLGTAGTVQERNGDYALGIFASDWCRCLDEASYRGCGTENPGEAMASGRWWCHESCWTSASKVAVETGREVDVECIGGLRIHAMPIRARGDVVGAINFAYGDPPRDPETLQAIASRFHVEMEELRRVAETYESRPPFIIELAKRRLDSAARFIGTTIERRRAEVELRELSRRQEAILASVPDIIAQTDPRKVYTWLNPAGFAFFGEDAVGKEAAFYFLGEQETYQTVQPLFDGSEDVIYVESWQRRRDGEKRLLAWWCRATRDECGNVTGALSAGQDITERKQAEAERERLLQELEAKNQELESLLYAASHDLRAPLVNIQGFSRELEQVCREPDPVVREEVLGSAVHFIRSSVRKMDALINGMLRVSRTGRAPLQPEQLDVEQILDDVQASLSYQIQTAAADVKIERLPGCYGDADQVNQAFTNLLDNALKYRDPQRPLRITVSGRLQDEETVYCVEDTGSGIPSRDLARVWEIFHRVHPQGPVEGEGVGLTLVRRIAERHHGRVRVESEPGIGSRFYLSLPRGVLSWKGWAQPGPDATSAIDSEKVSSGARRD